MNAGAYGGEIGELVEWVEAVDLEAGTAGVVRLTRDGMGFGYRQSVVQNRALAVTAAKLRLKKGEPDEISRLMAEYAERRRSRQPLEHPSAGSFFRRPAGHYVGPMIEACGLKGYRVGGAEVSVKHANFIVNVGGATAADVLAVAAHVQDVVEKQYGVRLEPEVRVLGEGT
jgi:UDP-N-acetylmuramate dehydrogenase